MIGVVASRRTRRDDGLAVEVGQSQVEQDQVRAARVPQPQRLADVARFVHLVAAGAEVAGNRGPCGLVVFDYQDHGTVGLRPRRPVRLGRLRLPARLRLRAERFGFDFGRRFDSAAGSDFDVRRLRLILDGQSDDHLQAAQRARSRIGGSAHRLGQTLDDRQPDPRAALRPARHPDDAARDRNRSKRCGITDAETPGPPSSTTSQTRPRPPWAETTIALAGRVPGRVLQQVGEDLVDEHGVDLDRREVLRHRDVQLVGRASVASARRPGRSSRPGRTAPAMDGAPRLRYGRGRACCAPAGSAVRPRRSIDPAMPFAQRSGAPKRPGP